MLLFSLATPGHAQSCSTSVTNKPGDTITITATLTTTDPDENGEGEPLLVTTSGGEFTETVSAYGAPQANFYTATAANETITGINLGADGDESCSLSATSKSNAWFTPQQKATATKLAAHAGTVSGAAWVLAELCTLGIVTAAVCDLPAGLVAASAALFTGLCIEVAADPPDSNYKQLAKPQFVNPDWSLVKGLPTALAKQLFSLLQDEAIENGLSAALYTTVNRASGADLAGDKFWVKQQTVYAGQLKSRIASAIALDAALLGHIQATMKLMKIDYSLTPDQVLQFEIQVAENGLSASELQNLQSAGTTDPTVINQITQILIVQDINTTSGPISAQLANPARISSIIDGVTTYGGVCAPLYFVDAAFGLHSTDAGFLSQADLNHDGVVNSADLKIALKKIPKITACYPDPKQGL
jgi:hypothetical protein